MFAGLRVRRNILHISDYFAKLRFVLLGLTHIPGAQSFKILSVSTTYSLIRSREMYLIMKLALVMCT